ncbi:MAG: GNAT family N-acetyltransferase [Candidatus Aenigmatarchaeota archaeon]
MQIRDFRPDDLEAILSFKQASVKISFPGQDYNLDLFRKSILKAAEKDPATIKVAEDQGKPAGYIWFRIKDSASGRHGVISHAFVDPSHRRRGLSLKLNQAAEDWFRAQGIDRIEVQITKTNIPSLEMCRKLGYKETRLVLEKRL